MLLKRQEHIARQAHVAVNASAKARIKQLVYPPTGYDATREEIINAFKFYVREEARDYEREFPNQIREWYRLYQLPEPERLHQFLSDIDIKALRQHLGQLLGIARSRAINANMNSTSE